MPYEVREFQETPNPASVKCVLDRPVAPLTTPRAGPRSYRSAADAAADPIASRLFGVSGVETVLIADTWLSVNKAPGVAWKTLKPALQRALREVP